MWTEATPGRTRARSSRRKSAPGSTPRRSRKRSAASSPRPTCHPSPCGTCATTPRRSRTEGRRHPRSEGDAAHSTRPRTRTRACSLSWTVRSPRRRQRWSRATAAPTPSSFLSRLLRRWSDGQILQAEVLNDEYEECGRSRSAGRSVLQPVPARGWQSPQR